MIDKYNKIYTKKIEENKERIIESFVKYYGEEYRMKITNNINSITYVWIRHKFLNKFYKAYGKELKYSEDIRYFLNYDINEVIGSNNKIDNNRKNYIKRLLNGSALVLASNITLFNTNNLVEIITFPMFLSTDRVLFHEINHVVVRENMFYIDDSLIRKDGLDVDTKYSILEEVINELSAKEITNIFHNLGCKILNNNLEIGNDYEKIFPIVEPFYNKYHELLKRVRISLNHNELFKYIDKNIYNEYVTFVNKIFYLKKEYDKNKKRFIIDEKTIQMAHNYINKMEIKDIKKLKLV